MKMNMNKWEKMLLGVFTGVCMLCMSAVGVKAAETYTCEMNGVKYESLQKAIQAVEKNGTASIKMISDETMTSWISFSGEKDVTLDLAGHHINYPGSDEYNGIQINNGRFTLDDSVGGGTYSVGNDYYGMIMIAGGEFVMNGGSIVHNDNPGINEKAIYMNHGSMVINGGTIQARFPFQCYGKFDSSSITINGGTFIGEVNSVITGDITANINGGSFSASDDDEALLVGLWEYGRKVPTVKISGGDFHGQTSGVSVYGTNYYEGYTYTPKDLLAEDCVWSDATEVEIYSTNIGTAKDVEVYRNVTENNITVNGIKDVTYTGNAVTQNITVAYKGTALENGKDYTVSYANNVNVGTATMTLTFNKPYVGTLTKTFQISKQQEENKTQTDTQTGKTVTVGSTISTKTAVYKVTKVNKTTGTVEYKKPANKKAKTIAIPDTVKVNGITYKVTGIAKNACKNNKKITKVTIGKNVSKIGKQAFYGCKNLKNITIKTTKLTSKNVGSKAFTGTPKKAKVKVPKSKLKAYKKMLVSKGISKKAKIKK